MNLVKKQFKNIDLNDVFFDSLKADYTEFSVWFAKKSEDSAYVFYSNNSTVDGFLYLKVEDEAILDVFPPLPKVKRIKVGTLKINPHGTRLGERFIKKIFDHAISEGAVEIYVTVFSKHAPLLQLFQKYGFLERAKKHAANGTEIVLVRDIYAASGDLLTRYPVVKTGGVSFYLLSLYPMWHTRLLPDSILRGEDESLVADVSHTNSIHKVYLAKMRGMENLKRGDILLIYRTSDEEGRAWYRSVATSVCVMEEYRNISDFSSEQEFVKYCDPYSVFTAAELSAFWHKKQYPHVIRFTYNFALPKRPTRGNLVENVGLSADAYWGFMPLTKKQFLSSMAEANVRENIVVD